MQVEWSDRARYNLSDIAAYIARDNAEAADRITDLILTATERLSAYPALGRSGRVDGTRELVVGNTPYIVPYRVHKDRVEIIAVLHGAQKWPTSL
jgi:toxin ParE1/3/4